MLLAVAGSEISQPAACRSSRHARLVVLPDGRISDDLRWRNPTGLCQKIDHFTTGIHHDELTIHRRPRRLLVVVVSTRTYSVCTPYILSAGLAPLAHWRLYLLAAAIVKHLIRDSDLWVESEAGRKPAEPARSWDDDDDDRASNQSIVSRQLDRRSHPVKEKENGTGRWSIRTSASEEAAAASSVQHYTIPRFISTEAPRTGRWWDERTFKLVVLIQSATNLRQAFPRQTRPTIQPHYSHTRSKKWAGEDDYCLKKGRSYSALALSSKKWLQSYLSTAT
jgi:hypothetical protein